MWGERRVVKKAIKSETKGARPVVEQAAKVVNEGMVEIGQRVGDLGKPRCPRCHDVMRQRVAKGGRYPFWGCSNYPRCRGFVAWKSWERFQI
jgi:ssDNA-binding Zn-finger/Zn-ribbon topoisomerase 1